MARGQKLDAGFMRPTLGNDALKASVLKRRPTHERQRNQKDNFGTSQRN